MIFMYNNNVTDQKHFNFQNVKLFMIISTTKYTSKQHIIDKNTDFNPNKIVKPNRICHFLFFFLSVVLDKFLVPNPTICLSRCLRHIFIIKFYLISSELLIDQSGRNHYPINMVKFLKCKNVELSWQFNHAFEDRFVSIYDVS